ncbi:hypothetical protein HDU81_001305 [Chytriomyces hyalinus]|nr:hypothetical protein HDU81_001305 [Chytriomyces hyalinus]
MDSEPQSVLLTARKEYTQVLVYHIGPGIYQGLQSIWVDCKTVKKNIILEFQTRLSRVRKWNQDMIENECQRIVDKSKIEWLSDLVKKIFVVNVHIPSVAQQDEQVQEQPVDQAPVEEPPAAQQDEQVPEQPIEQVPVEEQPVEQAPIEQPPVAQQDEQALDQPNEQTSIEEQPVAQQDEQVPEQTIEQASVTPGVSVPEEPVGDQTV